jgi:hypothetical protein
MSTKKPAKAAPGKKPAAKTTKKPAKAPAKVTPAAKKITPRKRDVTKGRYGVDLEAMERDYRTGRFTDQEIARKHGVARETVGRNARRLGWKKDLKDAIAQATRVAVAEAASQEALETVSQTIAENAELNKQVILAHRADVKSLRNQAFDLLAELKAANGTMEELRGMLQTMEDLEVSAIEGDPELSDRAKESRLRRLQKSFESLRKLTFEAADIHNRVGSTQKLMDVIAKAQTLERKAFGLDDKDGDKGGFESVLEQALE